MFQMNGLPSRPHLRDSRTCTLCSHRICTDISWRCSWSPTLPYPSRDWLQPAKEKRNNDAKASGFSTLIWGRISACQFPPHKTFIRVKGGIFTGQILSSAVTLYLSQPCTCSDRGPQRPCALRAEEDIVRRPVIKQRSWLVLFLQSIPFSSIKSWMTFPGSVCMTNTQRVTELIFKQSALCSLQSSRHGWNSLQRCNHHIFIMSPERVTTWRGIFKGKNAFYGIWIKLTEASVNIKNKKCNYPRVRLRNFTAEVNDLWLLRPSGSLHSRSLLTSSHQHRIANNHHHLKKWITLTWAHFATQHSCLCVSHCSLRCHTHDR